MLYSFIFFLFSCIFLKTLSRAIKPVQMCRVISFGRGNGVRKWALLSGVMALHREIDGPVSPPPLLRYSGVLEITTVRPICDRCVCFQFLKECCGDDNTVIYCVCACYCYCSFSREARVSVVYPYLFAEVKMKRQKIR